MKHRSLIAVLLILLLITACQPAETDTGRAQALVLDPETQLVLLNAKAPGQGSSDLSSLCILDAASLPATVTLSAGDLLALANEQILESFPCQLSADEVSVVTPAAEQTSHIYNANLNHAEALTQLDGGVLIDVRTPDEYNGGHLPGALLLPVDDLKANVETLVPDKETPVMVYCRSGNRSATAARTLNDLGYQVIFDLGGISSYSGPVATGMEP